MNTLIPKNKHSLIRICKILLELDRDITTTDVELLKEKIQRHLDNGLSPANIKKLYNIDYTDFGMFIKKCLGLSIKNSKEAVNNFYIQNNRSKTDQKELYKKQCQFTFNPYSIREIPGYHLLLELGIYHPLLNPNGVCRDHMISIEYGWRNDIDPSIISSPLNCQFITNIENIKKGSTSSITIDTLLEKIKLKNYSMEENKFIKLPKSSSHKKKISATNSKFMTITNGVHNLRVLKSSIIPEHYRRGMTRKNKMVVQPGLEPGNEIF